MRCGKEELDSPNPCIRSPGSLVTAVEPETRPEVGGRPPTSMDKNRSQETEAKCG